MALSIHERVGRALDFLKAGLATFVERVFRGQFSDNDLTTPGRRRPPLGYQPACPSLDRHEASRHGDTENRQLAHWHYAPERRSKS